MTEGKVSKAITLFSIYTMFGFISNMLMNIIEIYYVAKLGTQALTIVAYIFPLTMIMGGTGQGLSTSITAIISKCYGNDGKEELKVLTTICLLFSIAFILIVGIILIISKGYIMNLLNVEENLYSKTHKYIIFWILGLIPLFLSIICGGILRAIGKTKVPSIMMMFSTVFLFIGIKFLFEYDFLGILYALIIARSLLLIMLLYLILIKERIVTYKGLKFSYIKKTCTQIIKVGFFDSLTKVIVPIGSLIIIKIISKYGEDVVAAFGIYQRIESILIIYIVAQSVTLISFIGQNLGSNNYQRIIKGYKFSTVISFIVQFVVLVVVFLFGKQIATIFTKDEVVINIVYNLIVISSIGYGFMGIVLNTISLFNVFNLPYISTIVNVQLVFCLYVPLSILANNLIGYQGVMYAYIISSIITCIISIIYAKKLQKIKFTKYGIIE